MGTRTVIVTLLAAGALAAPGAATGAPRIVGGTYAAQDAYPAQAELDVIEGRDSYLCGGTLVAPQWVITAAHCVSDERTAALLPASDFTVRLGSTQLGAGTAFAADAVSRAPGYDARTMADDAALLHLSTPATQAPLGLIATGDAARAAAGQLGRVIGWGTTSEGGDVSPYLQEVDVPIVGDATCESAYGGSLTASMLCAGYAQGGKDACQGDSGGPLMVDVDTSSAVAWRLEGIVSTGDGCARAGKYGIYTDLLDPALRSWLEDTTGFVLDDGAFAAAMAPAETTPTGTSTLTPRARLRLPRSCSARACTYVVRSNAPGMVSASLRVGRAAARRLGLQSRYVGAGQRRFGAAGTHRVRIVLAPALRRRLGAGGVSAELKVIARLQDGTRSVSRRTVRVRA